MKKLPFILSQFLLLFILSACVFENPIQSKSALQGDTLLTYSNSRYGYQFDYPAGFQELSGKTADGDGVELQSAKGQVRILAFAEYDVLESGLAGKCRTMETLYRVKSPAETKTKDAFYLSWKEKTHDCEARVLYHQGVFFTIMVKFQADDTVVRPPVARILQSMRFD